MKKSFFALLAISLLMHACSDKKSGDTDKKENATMESKQERNKKIIMASMESFMKADYDGVFKDAAASFTDYTDGSMTITNLDSLKNFLKMLSASVTGYRGDNLVYYSDGDHVLVHGDWSGTFKNDLMGIKASGKEVKFRDVDIFKLNEEGKIVEHSAVQNLGAVLMASGMTQ